MRQRQIIKGIKNSQRIRVIVNGVGFLTTVKDTLDGMCFTEQRIAVWAALERIAREKGKITGFTYRSRYYDNQGQLKENDVQVDIL